MAGEGSRFKLAGYKDPKPFIDVLGKPMIIRVIENFSRLHHLINKLILICRSGHKERLKTVLLNHCPELADKVVLVTSDKLTEGAACTILLAENEFDYKYPVIVANSDQLVDWNEVLFFEQSRHSGNILLFKDIERNPKWSFAELDSCGFVIKIAEKVPISDYATVGIYYFVNGHFLIDSVRAMIKNNDRTNGEFYLCPAYNYLKGDTSSFLVDKASVHGLGTPPDLEEYIRNMAYHSA